MTPELQQLVERWLVHVARSGRTLEIGSYNVNGGVSQFFGDYTGIDMRQGPGVNMVMNSHDLSLLFQRDFFDTVVWLETFEHDDAFWLTMQEIIYVLKSGGSLIVSGATLGMPKHDFPSDYWRMTDDGLRVLLGDEFDIIDMQQADKSIAALARKK